MFRNYIKITIPNLWKLRLFSLMNVFGMAAGLLVCKLALLAGFVASKLFLYNFAYHVSVGIGALLFGFLSMLLIGGITIGWQTYRVAAHNPVTSIRHE